MTAPLACFLECLIASNSALISGPEQVKIVSDNCGKLSERARYQVRLSYAGPPVCGRWEESGRSCDAPTRATTNKTSKTIPTRQQPISNTIIHNNNTGCPVVRSCGARNGANTNKTSKTNQTRQQLKEADTIIHNSSINTGSPILPLRRNSLGAGEDRWCSSPHSCKSQHPPRDPTERSKLRWAMALDDLILARDDDSNSSETDSDDDDSTCYDDDDDSSCDDLDDDDSDSDSEDEGYSSDSCEEDGGILASHWFANEATAPHQWTLPPNCILPNIQDMIRKASQDRDFDMNQYLLSAAQPSP
jgi:hypothetical protein